MKTPYLIQENKEDIIGSGKFHKILLISKSDWQTLSSAGGCGLWMGGCDGWNRGLSECIGKGHSREGGQDAWIRCGSCTRLSDLVLERILYG